MIKTEQQVLIAFLFCIGVKMITEYLLVDMPTGGRPQTRGS